MKMSLVTAGLIAIAGPAMAQTSTSRGLDRSSEMFVAQAQMPPSGSGAQMPAGRMMGQMMGGSPMMRGQGTMGQGMMGAGRGMMGRFSPEDINAFIDAHIAAIHAGLKLTAEQERLWPPVEDAMRNLARLRTTVMQTMRQSRGMMESDPVGFLRIMADRMSQGSEAVRKLADAAAPLYATLDDAQKRRLQVLVRMGSHSMMGSGMMGRGPVGAGRAMMPGIGDDGDDDDNDSTSR